MRGARQTAFTIVEMVTVIAVMGILVIGTMRFMTDAASGFATTTSRAHLAGDAQVALSVMTRDLRLALPNSIRVRASGDCVEFVPVERGSVYLSAPIGSPGTDVWVVPVTGYAPAAGTRLAIQPAANVYSLSDPGAISPPVASTVLDPSGESRVTLTGAHQFTAGSARSRVYFVGSPVSYCVAGGALWRYRNYGFAATQPGPATLPAGLPGRVLIAQEVQNTLPVFAYDSATLYRNGVVSVALTVARAGDVVRLDHMVNVRNLP